MTAIERYQNGTHTVQDRKQLHREFFGVDFNPACSACIQDADYAIRSRIKSLNQTNQMAQLFKIKEGKLVQRHGCSPVSSKSSDAECIQFLRDAGSQQQAYLDKYFQYYPDNWQDLVFPKTPGEPAVNPVTTKTEPNQPKSLATMVKKDMQKLAADLHCPEHEWKKLGAEQLRAYLTEKSA